MRLCFHTIPQAKCNLWFVERFKRITSTIALELYNTWKSKRLSVEDRDEKILQLFKGRSIKPKSKVNPAMDYGNKHEENARKEYCKKTKNTVVDVGMIVKHKFDWLSGSPDGLIENSENFEDFGLLEIKCIYRCRDDDKIDECKDFLDKNGNLRQSHSYYTQVQLNAWITGAKFIHLFLYTPQDCRIVEVELDMPHV